MKLYELKALVAACGDKQIKMGLPGKGVVPDHFHVTEVGLATKRFVDCGGTVRETTACVLQAWVADDTDHRITGSKLGKILELGRTVLKTDDLDVEVEYGCEATCLYKVVGADLGKETVLIRLEPKRTACLAPDKCGVGKGCC